MRIRRSRSARPNPYRLSEDPLQEFKDRILHVGTESCVVLTIALLGVFVVQVVSLKTDGMSRGRPSGAVVSTTTQATTTTIVSTWTIPSDGRPSVSVPGEPPTSLVPTTTAEQPSSGRTTPTTLKPSVTTTTAPQIVEVPDLIDLSVPNAQAALAGVGLRLGSVNPYVSDGVIDACDPRSTNFPPSSGDVESWSVENNLNGSYVPIGSRVDLVVCP